MIRHGWLVVAAMVMLLLFLSWIQPGTELSGAPADGLPHPFIYGVDCSQGEDCWFATWGGIAVFDNSAGRFTSFTPANSGIAHQYTHDLAVDGSGYVWVGLHDGRGVSLLNHKGTLDNRADDTWITFTESDGLPKGHTWVEDIAIDSQGRLWFGHSLGATRLDHNNTPFNKEDDTWVDFSNASLGLSYGFVNVIFEDDQGCMWFGGDSGLSRDCGPLPGILSAPNCTNCCWSVQWLGYVWDIDQDQNGNIWIADGSCGAAKLAGNQWSLCDTADPDCPIPSENDGSDDGVRSVDVDPNNGVWFGTRGKGVARLNGFDDWTLYSSDGASWLGGNDVEDIDFSATGDGWFGTSNNAWLYRPASSASAEISPTDGGEVTAPDGRAKATFPSGSVAISTTVTWKTEGTFTGAGQFGVYVFDLTPDPVTSISAPYTLTMLYNKANIDPAKEATLGIYGWDGSQWVLEPTSDWDEDHKRVTASPNHMSLFAVIGDVEQRYLPGVIR